MDRKEFQINAQGRKHNNKRTTVASDKTNTSIQWKLTNIRQKVNVCLMRCGVEENGMPQQRKLW